MSGLQDLVTMGGYATWVWSAWSLSLVVLLACEYASRRRLARALARARRDLEEGR